MVSANLPLEPDFAIVGGGPAGYGAALAAANRGASVVLIDAGGLGGTCLNRGCIPAKYFLEAAAVVHQATHASRFGISLGSPDIDFSMTQQGKAELVSSIGTGLAKLLKSRGISVIEGFGTLQADRTVTVDDGEHHVVLSPKFVMLAMGSTPRALDALVVDQRRIVDSDGFLALDTLPERAVVVGGGAIGCEFASLLADLGVSVTLIESATSILSGCDADVAKVVHRSFVKRGITIVTDVAVTASEVTDDVVHVHLSSDTTIEAELVVVAVGRTSEVRGIGDGVPLERTDSGAVVVAEHQQTSLPGVYAIGDVVAGRPQLAHVGFAEAHVAVGHALGEPLPEVNNDAVPWAIYCRPEVAFVGLSEAQAIDRGYTVVTKREPLGGNSRAQIIGETEGLVKVVCAANADGSAGEILGVHLVGPWATEQLGHAELAVNLGLSVREVARFLAPHPSLSEHYGETLLALSGRGMHVRG